VTKRSIWETKELHSEQVIDRIGNKRGTRRSIHSIVITGRRGNWRPIYHVVEEIRTLKLTNLEAAATLWGNYVA
jgi:hypothetical protein